MNDQLESNLKVIAAMQLAAKRYPETGYCYHRAKMIQRLMGKGSVYTYSDKRFNYSFQHSDSSLLNRNTTMIKIPYDINTYRDCVEWAYHTVYELDGITYTYEIMNWSTPTGVYKERIYVLNPCGIVKRAEKKSISCI